MGAPHPERIIRLQRRLSAAGNPGMVVTDLVNVRYLSGFTGSNGLLLVPADSDPVFLTDGRYVDQARAEVVVDEQKIVRDLIGEAAVRDLTGWVAETHVLDVENWRRLGEPAPSGRLVEELRVVKDEHEIEQLRIACRISVAALEQLWSEQLLGRTEKQVAARLENLLREHGADDRAFDTIVAAGENSAIPHHSPTDRPIRVGDLLKIDFGAKVNGYHADVTRTVILGTPAEWQREIHAAVRTAQAAGVQMLREGTRINEVDNQVRAELDAAGQLEHFTTGLGHGVGLQIHEDPFFSARATGKLDFCTVLTMEPGIYLAGRGGVRIEDTVLVTEGDPEVLSALTTELMEIN